MERNYYVYILTTKHNSALYTGVTNDIGRRLEAHKNGKGSSYTAKYHITKLVHIEWFQYIEEAIAREKQIKSWSRKRKMELISRDNFHWSDLSKRALL